MSGIHLGSSLVAGSTSNRVQSINEKVELMPTEQCVGHINMNSSHGSRGTQLLTTGIDIFFF